MNFINSKSGFTLIEVLVVVAILSVLAIIVVPSVADLIEKARASSDLEEIAVMEKAIVLSSVDGRSYLSACYDMPKIEAVFRDVSDNNENYQQIANSLCNGTFDKDFMPQTARSLVAVIYNYSEASNKKLTVPSQLGYDYYYNVDTGLIVKAEHNITSREELRNILLNTRNEDDLTGKWINLTVAYNNGPTHETVQENSVLYIGD